MSGKSTQIYSVKFAKAASEGGDQDANHLPDLSGRTFVGMATTTATVDAFSGEEAFHEEDQGRRTPGENRPSAIGVINGDASAKYGAAQGEFIRALYPDEIAVAHRLRSPNGADPDTVAFGMVLNSAMGLYKPSFASCVTSSASANEGQLIVDKASHGDNIKLGAPLRVYSKAGGSDTFFHEYCFVTGKADDGTDTTLTIHPKLSFTPGNGQAIQCCYGFYPVVGSADTTLSNDLHMVFDMGGTDSQASVRRVASGCRMSSFSISNDNSGASLSMSLRPMVMLTDDANASTVSTSEPAGKLLQHRYGCRVDLADSHGAVASGSAASTARNYLPNFDHSIEVSFDTAPGTPETRGVVRGSSHEIHNATCAISITTEGHGKIPSGETAERVATTMQRLTTRDELRTLILGFGPGGNGATNPNGGAFIIKNAARADGSADAAGGEGNRIQQAVSLRAVSDFNAYAGTPADTQETNLASAPFLLVFPKA